MIYWKLSEQSHGTRRGPDAGVQICQKNHTDTRIYKQKTTTQVKEHIKLILEIPTLKKVYRAEILSEYVTGR